MEQDVLCFFDRKPEALLLYEVFEEKLFSDVDGVKVKVQKTQIAFSNRHNFAFVSFLPVRKAKERPEVYIVVTFGLEYRVESPRIDAAVEPYPGRWTHHVLISGTEEIPASEPPGSFFLEDDYASISSTSFFSFLESYSFLKFVLFAGIS